MSPDYTCHVCGGLFWVTYDGVANHIDGDCSVNHDLDADHVPYASLPGTDPTDAYKVHETELSFYVRGEHDNTIMLINKSWWVPGITSGNANAGTPEDRTNHHRATAHKFAAHLNKE